MNLEQLLDLWRREPARIIGAVGALITLLIAFGVQITSGQQDSILGVITAILFLIGAEVTRANVTPVE